MSTALRNLTLFLKRWHYCAFATTDCSCHLSDKEEKYQINMWIPRVRARQRLPNRRPCSLSHSNAISVICLYNDINLDVSTADRSWYTRTSHGFESSFFFKMFSVLIINNTMYFIQRKFHGVFVFKCASQYKVSKSVRVNMDLFQNFQTLFTVMMFQWDCSVNFARVETNQSPFLSEPKVEENTLGLN